MSTMKALTIEVRGGRPVVVDRPYPKIRSSYMLVKVEAVGLNPADILGLDYGLSVPGHLLGCDYAGTILELGTEIERDFKVGDRVCGCSRAIEQFRDDVGTFAEFVVVKADIPDHISFADAATLGVATITTGRCLFDAFHIPYPQISPDGIFTPPTTPERQILINGGSSCMGTMTTQYAKLANLHVLSTCSTHNFDLTRSYGADKLIDYHSSTATEDLASYAASLAPTQGPLRMCIDCICTPQSAIFSSKVLNPTATPPAPDAAPDPISGPNPTATHDDLHFSTLGPFSPPLPGIKTSRTMGYSFLGEEWEQMGVTSPASREDFEHARDFAIVAGRLLKYKLVKPHPADVRTGGLEKVEEGLQELKRGEVSGKKIVVVL